MVNTFLSLARNTKHAAIRANLLERLMRLFQQLGKDIPPPERVLSSPLMQGMGYLLPVIAELMRDHDTSILDPSPEADLTKLFRSVWFFCVLFKFVEREAWRTDWFEAVKKIGAKIPVLVSKSAMFSKKLELEVDSLLQRGFTEKV